MPSGTINGTTANVNVLIKVEWSESNVNIANNTSDVTAVIKMCRNDYDTLYWTRGTASLDVNIGGLTEHVDQYVSLTYSYGWVTVKTLTKTVPHDSNGSKTCTITVSGSILDTSVTSISLSGSGTLTPIARASQPTATNTSFGSATTITTNRASSSFTHTIVITFGSSHSQTLTNVGASTTWTVPASWADGIPNALSGTFGVTCTTYNGTTQIGQKTTTFTVSIPDSWKPTVSISKTLTNGGDNGQVLASVTTVNLTASGSAPTGTSIASYSWSGGTVSGTGASKTHSPTTVATFTYTVTVTDGRGRTGSASVTATSESGVSSMSCNSSVNFGSALAVTITRKKSSFTHNVTWQISSSYTNTATGQGTSASYTIPTSWAASVPAASSINMTVTVTTYNGSTSLGSTSKTVSVVVPSSWVPSFTLSATAVSAFNSQYLKGVSKITLSASSAAASTGSQIQSYQFTGNNVNKTATTTATSYSVTSDLLSVVGSNTYTVKVTDKRGRVTTKTTSITVVDYKAPTLSLSVGRYTSGGDPDNFGSYGRMTATGTYSAVTGNTWTLTLKQKKRSASSYTTVNTYSNQTGTISKTSSLFAADVDSVYDCQATLTDAVGKSVTKTVAISTGKAIMDWFKDKVVTIFSTANESIRSVFSNPNSLFYSGADINAFNGRTVIPALESFDLLTAGGFNLNRVSTAALLGAPQYDISNSTNYDLNNAYQIGTYVCGSSATGQTVVHTPYAGAFRLFVTTIASSAAVPDTYVYRNQILVSIEGGIYGRYGSTSTGIANMVWSSWQRLLDASDIYPTLVTSSTEVDTAVNKRTFVPIRTGSAAFTLGGRACPAYARGWAMNFDSNDGSMFTVSPYGLFEAFRNGSTWTAKPLYPVEISYSSMGSYIASVERCSCWVFGDMVYGGCFVTVKSNSGNMTTGSTVLTLNIPRNFSKTVDIVGRAGSSPCAMYATASSKDIKVNQQVSAGSSIVFSFVASMNP